MPELEKGLVDGGELNFNQSFLKFNACKEKIKVKDYSQCDFKFWILDTANLSSKFIAKIMPTSQQHFWARSIDFFLNVNSTLCGTPL